MSSRNVTNLFPLVKMAEKHGGLPQVVESLQKVLSLRNTITNVLYYLNEISLIVQLFLS